jgi:glycolate oxidase FAD binding subunit
LSDTVTPRSASEAAAVLAGAAAQGRQVRITGGATKLGWGGAVQSDALRLQTVQLDRVQIHNAAQPATATLGAGTPIAQVQAHLARSGMMLAIDPQLGLGQRPAATVGGVVATADGGPLSHGYGVARDQILGVALALSNGTVLQCGPRADIPQNGYDLAKLVTGSFGTLGVLLSVDVRLHPLPSRTATALGSSADPAVLGQAVMRLAHTLHALQAFDVAWREGQGGLLAQFAGDDAEADATRAAVQMQAAGLAQASVRTDDATVWARQRAGQRSADRAVLRVHAKRSQLPVVLARAAEADATLVGRAALGISYLTVNVNRITGLRAGLPEGCSAVLLDLPQTARGAVDAWGAPEGPELEFMRQIKRSFDPAGVCNPGVFVGRI